MTLTETIARGIAVAKGIEICSDASYEHSAIGALAKAAVTALTEAGYAIVPVGSEGAPLRIPRPLYDALGNLVSHCADQRDIYPDAKTALEVITDAVNLLYACIEDGVFGPLDSEKGE